jgi:hypothetical protein
VLSGGNHTAITLSRIIDGKTGATLQMGKKSTPCHDLNGNP